eukprot:351104-Chlamydomonas_euryale.AAC.4
MPGASGFTTPPFLSLPGVGGLHTFPSLSMSGACGTWQGRRARDGAGAALYGSAQQELRAARRAL